MSKEVQQSKERLQDMLDGKYHIYNKDLMKYIETLLQDHEKQNKIIYQLKDAIVKYEKAEHYRVESDVVEYFKDTLNGKENNLF